MSSEKINSGGLGFLVAHTDLGLDMETIRSVFSSSCSSTGSSASPSESPRRPTPTHSMSYSNLPSASSQKGLLSGSSGRRFVSKVISPLQTQQNFSLSDTGSPDSMTMSGFSLRGDLRELDKSPRGRAISTACDKISTKRGPGKAKKMFSKLKGNSFKFRSLKRT